MIKLLILILCLTAMGLGIQQSDTFATVEITHYRFYASVFTWLACFFLGIFLFRLLLSPFKIVFGFNRKMKQKKEDKRKSFIETVFQALINQNVENFERLSNESKKFFTTEDPLYWEIQTLLFPTKENYQMLTTFPQTVLGGIRGLFRYADSEGDYQKMYQLLNSLSPQQLKTTWAKQALFQMAVQENDWEKALTKLKELKSVLNQKDYQSNQAGLLLLMGKIKEAYKLDSEHPAIAIAWAKANPKKALRILQKAWTVVPNWEIYLTLKKINEALKPKQQIHQIKDLVHNNAHHALSLLAMADIYLTHQEPVKAKVPLDEYLQSRSLTQTVAKMMAKIERDAWHHEEQAKEWEVKANQIEEENIWTCEECGAKFPSWHGCCPACHTFNSLR